ncbi:mevalonate kinase [soil metagenome]
MSQSVGRASGKVILLGEHAVVYGIPAIAVGIDRGASATARAVNDGKQRLRVTTWGAEVDAADESRDLARAFASLLKAARIDSPIFVEAEADLPPGGGLGCSAALGVAVARAVVQGASDDQTLECAMAWERVFHGNPSGVDAAVATLGGSVRFEKGQPIETLSVRAPLHFAIGHSGIASSTRSMVESVARQRDKRPDSVRKSFEGIASLVRNARIAIEGGDRPTLGKLMDLNQMILAGLMLSTEEIEKVCRIAREGGALGSKLTGAGGGGCVVALADSRAVAESVCSAWRGAGFESFATETRGQGSGTRVLRFAASGGASTP